MWNAYTGSFKMEWQPKKASQVLSEGAVIDLTSGYLTVCDATAAMHHGVSMKTVTAGDSDYSATTRIPVQVPCSPKSKFKFSILSTDTLLATHRGGFFNPGGSPVGIDVTIAAFSHPVAEITDYLGANLAAGHLSSLDIMLNGK